MTQNYNWQPGDLAMITVPKSTLPGEPITASGSGDHLVVRDERGWGSLTHKDYYWEDDYAFFERDSPRPVLVVDPGHDRTVIDISQAVGKALSMPIGADLSRIIKAVLANLSSQLKSRIPEEPMKWLAVVEDTDGYLWFTHRNDPSVEWRRPWYSTELEEYRDYKDISVASVVSPGVDVGGT